MELINYTLFVDFIVPLFEGKMFDYFDGSIFSKCPVQENMGKTRFAETKTFENGSKHKDAKRKFSSRFSNRANSQKSVKNP